MPFDDAAYQRCIDTLGDVIREVLVRQQRPVLSFVDADTPTTHGAMLDRATRHGDLQIERHAKRALARVSPLEHLQAEIERFGLGLSVPFEPACRRRRELR